MKRFSMTVVAVTIVSWPVGMGAQDSLRQPAPQNGGLVMQFGQTLPAHEKLRAWVAANPAFRNHLDWLNANLGLPGGLPVVFRSCGTVNAFYSPSTRSITMCYELIARRLDRARAQPGATDAAVADAVTRSTLFILNHETGHALVDRLSLPVLGREEDAADGFGAFILLDRGMPQDAYSVFQGAEAFGHHNLFDTDDVADEHSLNDQRYYNILCWMFGSDEARFDGYAQRGGYPRLGASVVRESGRSFARAGSRSLATTCGRVQILGPGTPRHSAESRRH